MKNALARELCLLVVVLCFLTTGCSRKLSFKPSDRGNSSVTSADQTLEDCQEPLTATLRMTSPAASVRVGDSVQWEIKASGGCGSTYRIQTSTGPQHFERDFRYQRIYAVVATGVIESLFLAALDSSGQEKSRQRIDSSPFNIIAGSAPPPSEGGTVVIGVPIYYPPLPPSEPPQCSLEVEETAPRVLTTKLRLRGTIARALVNGIEVAPLPAPPTNVVTLDLELSNSGDAEVNAEVLGPNGERGTCVATFEAPEVHPAIAQCLSSWPNNVPFTFAELANPRIVNANFAYSSSTTRSDGGQGRGPELVLVNVGIAYSSSNHFNLTNPNAWYCVNIDIRYSSSNHVTYPCSSHTFIASHSEYGSSSNRVYCN